MKITGIIAEYNPFHNGHQYHIEKALEMTDSDAAIVLMSGDFVQRGTPAIMPKHLRAETALKGGASVIIELPVCFACGSAEYFARGAISIFNDLGCVDSICFGSECGDLNKMKQIAEIFSEEPEGFQKILQNYLRQGLSFPSARQKALNLYSGDPELTAILDSPNNILGVEYLKAIHRTGSRLNACTIKRVESRYHDTELSANYSSASAIRRLFTHDTDTQPREFPSTLKSQLPSSGISVLRDNYLLRYPVHADDFSLLLKYKLLTETKDSLTEYADVTQDLANRIMNQRNRFQSWNQFCDLLKTREITFTRVSRMLLHILLNIRKNDIELYSANSFTSYARILGFKKSDATVLKEIKTHSQIPLITKLGITTSLTPAAARMLETDLFAADLYESVTANRYGCSFINEYCQEIRIV